MTTIYDVAKAAGVTAATVSYALSGKRSVSEETRERVMKCARELGYRPNQIARSLTKQKTMTIGLVVPTIDNPFYAGIARAAESITHASGFCIFVTSTYRDERLAQKLLDDLLSRRVDGIIIASDIIPFAKFFPPSHTATELAVPLPIVSCLWEAPEPDLTPAISYDFYAAGKLAAQHLLGLGHRRIGVIVDGISPDGITLKRIHHSARLRGFEETLSAAGHPLDRTLVRAGDSSLESGKKAGYQLLQDAEPPTALFATNDLMALGAIAAAWELSITVPEQLSVVGFDDIRLASYSVPPLTTVILPESAVAEQSLDLLFRMIEGKTVTSPPVLQPRLIVRHSTAPPFTCAEEVAAYA